MDEFLFSVMAAIAVTLAVDAVKKLRSTMDSVQSYVDSELERRAAESAAEPKGDKDNG